MTAATEIIAHRICPVCEACCGLELRIADGKVTSIRGHDEDVFSGGYICPKGAALKDLHEDPDRLRTPLIKRHGRSVEAGWDEATRLPKALDAELRKIAKRYRRSRSFMISEAISDFVELERMRQAALQEGRDAIRRGAYADHDEVEAWARSLGSAKQRPRPDRKRARAA